MNRSFYHLTIALVAMLLFLSVGLLEAANVANILDLWEVRDGLTGDYTQTDNIDLDVTNPTSIAAWATDTTYSVDDIIEYTDGFAYYCILDMTTTDGTQDPGNTTYWTKMWEADKGWEPIGTESSPFTGNYDGDGKTISNLYIARGADTASNNTFPANGENHVGLFGYVSSNTTANNYIKNVKLTDVDVTGKRGTGALIGKVMMPSNASKTTFTENCSVDGGTVTGFGATGGLVGANNSDRKQQVPVIQYCWSNVTVASTHPLNTSLNSGDNNNPYNIKYGGIVGCNETGVTFDSYARGAVSGGDRVGGVAGCTIDGAVIRCYATGDVTQNIGSSAWEGGVGGITGRITGKLPPGLGGFQGSGSVQDSYYLDTVTITEASGNPGDPLLSDFAITDTEMQTQSTFTNWDFSSVWSIDTTNDNYPHLISNPTTDYYYYTTADGNWNGGTSVWNRTASSDYTGGSATSIIPDYTNSLGIKVLHEVTVTADISVDNTTIASAGELVINTGITVTVENGVEQDDMLIEGVVSGAGTLKQGSSSQIKVATGSSVSGITIAGGVATNLVVLASPTAYTPAALSVDGLNSPEYKYLSFPATDDLISSFSASTSAGNDNMPQRIDREWEITGNAATGSGGINKTITFYWNATDDNSYDWVANSAVPSVFRGENEITSSSYDIESDPRSVTVTVTFSEAKNGSKDTYTIGRDDDQTLPVQLSSFTALVHQGSAVKIQWTTQSETNVQGFWLYRNNANELESATRLATLIPATNTSQAQYYMFIDRELYGPGTYHYWLESVDFDGSSDFFGPINVNLTSQDQNSTEVPALSGIAGNYPNPFNPDTTIRYGLKDDAYVTLDVYNLRGQMIRRLVDADHSKGWHQVIWDGRNAQGDVLANGVYFLRLNAGRSSYLHKAVLMK